MALPAQTPEKKERLISEKEKLPLVEPGVPKEVAPELKDYLERVETGEEIQLPQPVTDDAGQPLVSPAVSQQVVVDLPLTDEETKLGLTQKVTESVRWLAEWTKRLLKIVGGRFIYKYQQNESS